MAATRPLSGCLEVMEQEPRQNQAVVLTSIHSHDLEHRLDDARRQSGEVVEPPGLAGASLDAVRSLGRRSESDDVRGGRRGGRRSANIIVVSSVGVGGGDHDEEGGEELVEETGGLDGGEEGAAGLERSEDVGPCPVEEAVQKGVCLVEEVALGGVLVHFQEDGGAVKEWEVGGADHWDHFAIVIAESGCELEPEGTTWEAIDLEAQFQCGLDLLPFLLYHLPQPTGVLGNNVLHREKLSLGGKMSWKWQRLKKVALPG